MSTAPAQATRTAETDAPTLTGVLSLDLVRGRPVLTLSVRCPHCRGPHHHTWGFDPLASPGEYPSAPTHREPHCWRSRSPYRRPHGTGYLVAPADTPANARILERYARAMECATASHTGTTA